MVVRPNVCHLVTTADNLNYHICCVCNRWRVCMATNRAGPQRVGVLGFCNVRSADNSKTHICFKNGAPRIKGPHQIGVPGFCNVRFLFLWGPAFSPQNTRSSPAHVLPLPALHRRAVLRHPRRVELRAPTAQLGGGVGGSGAAGVVVGGRSLIRARRSAQMSVFVVLSCHSTCGSSNSTFKSEISAASQSTFRPCASMISHKQHQVEFSQA